MDPLYVIPASARPVSPSCLKASTSCGVNPAASITCGAFWACHLPCLRHEPKHLQLQLCHSAGLGARGSCFSCPNSSPEHCSPRQQSPAGKVAGWAPPACPSPACLLCVPHSEKWWFGECRQAQLQCTAAPTWQTPTSAFLSQLQCEIQRPYHTSSKIKIIITKHSLEEDCKGDYVIKSFFLLECIKRLGSLLWIPDKLCIIFLFELAWFIYLLIINI